MTTIGKGADLMEVLKKKMRQSKEELERVRDENEELTHKLQLEIQRRETVSRFTNELTSISSSLSFYILRIIEKLPYFQANGL